MAVKLGITIESLQQQLDKATSNLKIITKDEKQILCTTDYVQVCCTIDNFVFKRQVGLLKSGVHSCKFCRGWDKHKIQKFLAHYNIKLKHFESIPEGLMRIDEIMVFECLIEGYTWKTSFANLKKKPGCSTCRGTAKFTFADIVEKVRKINPHIVIKEPKVYICTKKLKCYCAIDGHKWEILAGNLLKGVNCKKCTGRIPITSEELIKNIEQTYPIKVMDMGKLQGWNTIVQCQCTKDGYIWKVRAGKLKGGQRCAKCVGVAKRSFQSVKEEIESKYPTIVIDTKEEEYKYTKSPLRCRCVKEGCGHEWVSTKDTLLKGHVCVRCNNHRHYSWYTRGNARKYKEEWLNTPAIVYILKIWNENEEFHKIGITTKTIKRRFRSDMPYKYRTIDRIETNLYQAIHMEKKLHKIHDEYSYKPKIKFGGYTECFTKVVTEEINKYKGE